MTIPDPWQTLATDWPKVEVFVRYLPDRWGQTVWDGDRPHVELAHDLGPVQRRCTLAHELHHLYAGRPCSSFCGGNERDVTEATARWLLPDITVVGDALRNRSLRNAAEALQVTRQVLNDRLDCMTDAEISALERIVEPGAATGTVRAADGPGRRPAARPQHRCRSDAREGPDARTAPLGQEQASSPPGQTTRTQL